MKAFRESRFALFVSILACYLLERTAMSQAFMPPLGIHFRKCALKSSKSKLNVSFVKAFKYYALFFGGCIFNAEVQVQRLENLRGRFNAKVDHIRAQDDDESSYISFPGHISPYTDLNAF